MHLNSKIPFDKYSLPIQLNLFLFTFGEQNILDEDFMVGEFAGVASFLYLMETERAKVSGFLFFKKSCVRTELWVRMRTDSLVWLLTKSATSVFRSRCPLKRDNGVWCPSLRW